MGINSQTFSDFEGLKVLIVGDVMIDCYYHGAVDRISPEAPVPVVTVGKEEYRLGGAANVALNVKAMGAEVFLCSAVGMDKESGILFDLLRDNKIPISYLINSRYRHTTTKTRILSKNQQLLRFDREHDHDLSEKEELELLQKISHLIKKHSIDVILFQDYNKGVLTVNIIREVLHLALRENIPTIVDPKHRNFFEYKQVTLFKPNLREVKENLHVQISGEKLDDLESAAAQIRQQLSNKYTLITLSEHGIYLGGASPGAIFPTQKRQIADVCGAGDTVVSIVALGLGLGLNMDDVAILANLAGGQVCERVGVVPVNKAQLMLEYQDLIEKIEFF